MRLAAPETMTTPHDDFAKIAPFYDLVTRPIRGLRRHVVDLAKLKPGLRVLDVATGTGAQALAFADAGATRVFGVDRSPAMLDIARRHNRYPSVVEFVEGDAADLPFEDASFDVTCISFGLHEVSAELRPQVVRELARVTRPGGTIIVVDYVLPRNATAAAWLDRIVGLYEGEHYTGFVRTDLRALLATAGIVLREEHRRVLGAVVVDVATRPAPT